MSAGYVNVLGMPFIKRGMLSCHIHIGVGFCVARSDYDGQCEGLKQRDE